MDNDNIKRDENLQDISAEDITFEEKVDTAEKTVNVEETETFDDILEEAEEVVSNHETEFDGENLETVEAEEVILTEEEIAEIETKKRKKRKRNILISIAAAVLVAVVAFFVCYVEGVGDNTIANHSVLDFERENAGFWDKLKGDDIRYENPIVTLFDKMTGRNKDIVMKIGGVPVTEGVFDYSVNSSAINCAYTLISEGWLEDIGDLDWNDIDPGMDVSYLELSRNVAVETLLPIYATISVGEKNGVALDEADHKKIKDWIAQQKENFGDEFEAELEAGGYNDEEALYEIQRIQVLMQKVYDDVNANPEKYITNSFKRKMGKDLITAKHILIGFEADENGNVSKDAKQRAKKTAEDVLKMVEDGKDFDALVSEYSTDPGATEEGYTFAHDGSMVEEFEDAAFLLNIGETSGIVETDYGYHIIKRVELNITPESYIETIQKSAPVVIKKGTYKDTKVTLDVEAYFDEMMRSYLGESTTGTATEE